MTQKIKRAMQTKDKIVEEIIGKERKIKEYIRRFFYDNKTQETIYEISKGELKEFIRGMINEALNKGIELGEQEAHEDCVHIDKASKTSHETYQSGFRKGEKKLLEEFFNDKVIEALLCSCDAIQKLKLKDSNKICTNHKKICHFISIKEIYTEKLQKKRLELQMPSKSRKQMKNEGIKPLCYFCKKSVGKRQMSKHHIHGRKNSTETEWCHKSCHKEFHHEEQLKKNKQWDKGWNDIENRDVVQTKPYPRCNVND